MFCLSKHFFSLSPTSFRGRCRVAHYQDIEEARAFKPDPDTFFYILTYNPEARRLANTQGEIRVGPSHQAKLPLLKSFPSATTLTNALNDEAGSLREEVLWRNKTSDIDLSMYLQAARSIAAFAGMCDRGLPEDMYEVAQRDDTTINALTVLHGHDYDCKRAIQALVKCPIPKGIDRKWSDDDQKKFIKGLRQYGKNFYRIRKEHLPHKETSDLVEFYYLWKKTPQAQSSRPRRRQRPCSTSVNLSTTPTPAKQRNAKSNNKDGSEQNSDNDDNATTDTDEQYCRHCQTVGKDLQAGGRDSQMLCYDCRMYYKKYGEMPIINQEPPPYLFKPLNETSPRSSSSSKRKRSRLRQSPPPPPPPPPPSTEKSDENTSAMKTSSTRSKKKTRANELLSSIKQDGDEEENLKDEPSTNPTTIKLEEQENEKPSNGKTRKLSQCCCCCFSFLFGDDGERIIEGLLDTVNRVFAVRMCVQTIEMISLTIADECCFRSIQEKRHFSFSFSLAQNPPPRKARQHQVQAFSSKLKIPRPRRSVNRYPR